MAWRTIRWDNVKIIKSFHVVAAGFYPKQVNAYVIYPRVKKSSMLSVTGSIAFNNGFSDMNQLIELLNLYIRENNIKVEVQSKGTKTIATQLEK